MDYTNEGFTFPIIRDDVKGYASVHSILYREEDGLDVTGQYFVYLLHPVMGSTHFTLEPTTSHTKPWAKVGGAIWVDNDLIREVVSQIELRKNASSKISDD